MIKQRLKFRRHPVGQMVLLLVWLMPGRRETNAVEDEATLLMMRRVRPIDGDESGGRFHSK